MLVGEPRLAKTIQIVLEVGCIAIAEDARQPLDRESRLELEDPGSLLGGVLVTTELRVAGGQVASGRDETGILLDGAPQRGDRLIVSTRGIVG